MNNLPQFKDTEELLNWLGEIAKEKELEFLLAFMDDGVVWGYIAQGELHLSTSAFQGVGAILRYDTIKTAHLFGNAGEFILNRSEAGFAQYWLTEKGLNPDDYFDENYLLWGESATSSQDGFTLFEEGRQGLKHAPPILGKIAVLKVRHYYGKDEYTGKVFIANSRLLGLINVPEVKA